VPALAAMLVRVIERRRERSVWKFRPWSREVKLDRNAVGRERCVKPPDVVNWPPGGLCSKYRRGATLSESCTHTTRSQIWDGGETVKSQHEACPELQSVG
jgi:hypothetical protein